MYIDYAQFQYKSIEFDKIYANVFFLDNFKLNNIGTVQWDRAKVLLNFLIWNWEMAVLC